MSGSYVSLGSRRISVQECRSVGASPALLADGCPHALQRRRRRRGDLQSNNPTVTEVDVIVMSPRRGTRNIPVLRSPIKQSGDQLRGDQLFVEVPNHLHDVAMSGYPPEMSRAKCERLFPRRSPRALSNSALMARPIGVHTSVTPRWLKPGMRWFPRWVAESSQDSTRGYQLDRPSDARYERHCAFWSRYTPSPMSSPSSVAATFAITLRRFVRLIHFKSVGRYRSPLFVVAYRRTVDGTPLPRLIREPH